MKYLFLVFWSSFFPLLSAIGQDVLPRPNRYQPLVDSAFLFSEVEKKALRSQIGELNQAYGIQLCMVSVQETSPLSTRAYAMELGNQWGIGDRSKQNGVLMLIVKERQEMALELGSWWRGRALDSLKHEIIEETMLPAFRQAAYATGATRGLNRVKEAIAMDYELPFWQRKQAWGILMWSASLLGMLLMFYRHRPLLARELGGRQQYLFWVGLGPLLTLLLGAIFLLMDMEESSRFWGLLASVLLGMLLFFSGKKRWDKLAREVGRLFLLTYRVPLPKGFRIEQVATDESIQAFYQQQKLDLQAKQAAIWQWGRAGEENRQAFKLAQQHLLEAIAEHPAQSFELDPDKMLQKPSQGKSYNPWTRLRTYYADADLDQYQATFRKKLATDPDFEKIHQWTEEVKKGLLYPQQHFTLDEAKIKERVHALLGDDAVWKRLSPALASDKVAKQRKAFQDQRESCKKEKVSPEAWMKLCQQVERYLASTRPDPLKRILSKSKSSRKKTSGKASFQDDDWLHTDHGSSSDWGGGSFEGDGAGGSW
ncbi:MAG: TPM domain-containing protein [Bacteroidota bacterium]